MRETMKLFQQRLLDGKIPGPLLKLYMQHLLLGLDYIHSECGVLHTGGHMPSAHLKDQLMLNPRLSRHQAGQYSDGDRGLICAERFRSNPNRKRDPSEGSK
jgi:hypothetical protein